MPEQSSPVIDGKYILDLVTTYLGGYANAFEPKDLFAFINEGKDAVWAVMKTLRRQYFVRDSQSTVSTDDNYFGVLSTTTREYTLPVDCREVLSMEVLTSGYEGVEFKRRPLWHSDFTDARRTQTAQVIPLGGSVYYYDIVGARTLTLAQFPQAAFDVKIRYVRSLPDVVDVESRVPFDEILHPYVKQIAKYAAKLATLVLQDQQMSEAWKDEWRASVRGVEVAASLRQSTDVTFVEDFEGGGGLQSL